MPYLPDALLTEFSGSSALRTVPVGAYLGTPVVLTGSGPVTVYTPHPGRSLRLLWLGIATSEENAAPSVVTVKLSGSVVYRWPMSVPGAFVHSTVRIGGPNGALTVEQTQSSGSDVYINVDIQEI